MTPRVDRRRTRRWTRLASVLSVAVILGSCGSPSPTASPRGSGSITKSSAPGRSSSPGPKIEADSATKIDAAERAGTIDHDTALLYKLYASLAYGSLPVEYQSSNPAAPEATAILAELSGRLGAMSPELRAKVSPFFLRPTDPGSFWQTRSATAAVDTGAIALAAFHDVIEYAFVDAKQTSVRVWYAVPGGSSEQVLAQRLADEIDSSTMWAKEKTAMLGHEPCTDANSPNNGGDGRLDVYLVYPLNGLDWGGRKDTLGRDAEGRFSSGANILEPVERPDCPHTSHIIVNASLDFDHLKNATAHELFHAFQLSFKNAALADRNWWAEASATWAMDLVYPTLNFEQPYLDHYWSKAGGFEEGPLDSTTGLAAYGAYLWPFYLVQKSGDKSGTVVGQLWQASETQSPIQAISQLPGWSDSFKEFALWNWNKDSVVKYVDAGAQIPAANLSQDTTCIDSAASGNDCPLIVGKTTMLVTQEPTTVQYYEGAPDKQVEMLTFDLTQLQGKPGVGIQAILSIGGDAGTKVEDWTGLSERKFCLNSEDLRKIVLVVSNSSVASGQTVEGGIKVEAAVAGCSGWSGTMTGTDTWSRGGNSGRATSTFSGLWTLDPTADSLCTLAPTPFNDKVACVTYRPTGTVTWAWDAHISGAAGACDSTTAGSQDPANLPDKNMQAEAQLFFAPVDKDHLQVSGLGVVDTSGLDCNEHEQTAPAYFELSDLAWSGQGPSSDGGTCMNTTWQIARTAGTFAGSCIAYAYDVPGDYTHKLVYTWNLTRVGPAPGS